MSELTIVGWTNFECEYPSRNVEGDDFNQIVQLIAIEVFTHGYCFTGQEHQTASSGVPVFSDGTCFRASMRVWGSIMATIYSLIDGKEYSHMDFYMSSSKKTVLPENKPIDVEPTAVENERPGTINGDDIELISSSIQGGIELVTFDKVIKKYYDLVKNQNQ